MYKILVCDDEKWIRQGIILKIQRMGLPISEVLGASDTEEAMEIFEREKPHIIVSDIRMGDSSGLDFLNVVAEKNPDTKFIVISGYSEFDYAKYAIKLNVIEYLLKPIDDEKLKEALKKAIDKYEQDRINAEYSRTHTQLVMQNKSYEIEKLINQIFFYSNEQRQKTLVKKVKKLQQKDSKYYQCIIIQIEESTYSSTGFQSTEVDLLKYGIKNIIMELFEIHEISAEFIEDFKNKRRFIILMQGDDAVALEHQTKIFAMQICSVLRNNLSVHINISVSCVHDDINSKLYYEAVKAVRNDNTIGGNEIYFYNKYCENESENSFQLPIDKFKQLEKYLQETNCRSAQKVIHEILFNSSADCKNKEYIAYVYLKIINILLDSGEETISMFRNSGEDYLNIDILDKFENAEQIEDFINTMIERSCDMKMNFFNVSDCKIVMDKVKRYIDKNYMNELSVSNLAKLFNINYSYFSSVFKEQIGLSPTKYIRSVRIGKACEMLENSDDNIELIASNVGVNDPEYFYRIFKQFKGVTPTEYRKNHKKQN